MNDYINREALGIGFCNPDVFKDKGYATGWNAAIQIIKDAPAADVREVKRGVWCPQPSEFEDATVFVCSNCGHMILVSNEREELPFCGNCGADMRWEQTWAKR